jgi:nonsense-mediated mRNA decay protein 3
MFCVECGKKGEIFRDAVCIDCYIKTHSFSKGPKFFDLYICSHCGSYKYKNSWISDSFEEIFNRWIKQLFDISRELNNTKIYAECNEEKERIKCKVTIKGFLDDKKITEKHDTIIRKKKDVCDVCSKQFGGYHEAIVQIRADNRKLTKNEIKKIKKYVESLVKTMQEKGHRGLFITDMGEEHGGLNFYLSDKGSALTITKKIQENYGGEIKKSSKNIGMKDSKQLYRMTYLLRLPSIKMGDFISHDNAVFKIYAISRNKVHIFELSRWTKKIYDIKELETTNILGRDELIKDMILVSQTKEEVQLMDPKTYKTFEVRKPKKIYFDLKKIKIVKIEDEIFLLPENNINHK